MDAWLSGMRHGESKKRARVPDDLESLPREDLVALVRGLATERDALEFEKTSKKQATTPATSAAAKPAAKPPASAGVDAKSVQTILRRLCEKSEKAIKKTKHSQSRKPYTEVTEGCPSKELAVALMRGQSAYQKSDTARMTRWLLPDAASTSAWLGIGQTVHPVAFDGKVWCFGGQRPSIYAHAKIESLEVKFEAHACAPALQSHRLADRACPCSAILQPADAQVPHHLRRLRPARLLRGR